MLVRLSKWLLVLTLCASIGAHWAILQSVAWFGMALSYSQCSSIKEGLAKTFDGKHPCKLCKIVAEGKKSEQKKEAQFKITKLDPLSIAQLKPLSIPRPAHQFFPTDSFFLSRTETPLTPPPRTA